MLQINITADRVRESVLSISAAVAEMAKLLMRDEHGVVDNTLIRQDYVAGNRSRERQRVITDSMGQAAYRGACVEAYSRLAAVFFDCYDGSLSMDDHDRIYYQTRYAVAGYFATGKSDPSIAWERLKNDIALDEGDQFWQSYLNHSGWFAATKEALREYL